jgi:phosphotransferase system enzyme I (PtsI)
VQSMPRHSEPPLHTGFRKRLWGKNASPGWVVGEVLLLDNEMPPVQAAKISDPAAELQKLEAVLTKAKADLEALREKTLKSLGEEKAQIFEAHQMILEDPEFIDAIKNKISAESYAAAYAVQEVAREWIVIFQNMENEYMRERAADIRDLSQRLLRYLLGKEVVDLASLNKPVVLVAHDLTPSDTAAMNKDCVLGFLTNIGGKTSHTAIMARSFEIPAVQGLKDITHDVKTGDWVAFNGETGEVYVDPAPALRESVLKLKEEEKKLKEELRTFVGKESVSADGKKVLLVANIGSIQDLSPLHRNDAEGVGLFRTEFLYMDRGNWPSEDEQYDSYVEVLQSLRGKPVVIRTLDIGGDKELSYMKMDKELNPFLGLRAIRFCLKHRDIFRTQLRALLRASVHGKLAVMFPMISSLEEFLEAKKELLACREALVREGKQVASDIEVGMMVEIPAAAVMADQFAKHADFLSIGTNDLIQYLCAVDRMNEAVHDLYDFYHPALWRLMKFVNESAVKQGKWVGICGEVAGQVDLAPLLAGLGVHELSMAPPFVLKMRQAFSKLNAADCAKVLEQVVAAQDSTEVRRILGH